MTRKSRVLLAMGILAGIAMLAAVFFRTGSVPPEARNSASSMRDYFVERASDVKNTPSSSGAPESWAPEVKALIEERHALDETVWAQEVAAQEYEETIVKYWDQMLRPDDDKYAVLATIPFETITLDAPGETIGLEWGIKRTTFEGHGRTLTQNEWREFLRDMEGRGYGIRAIEFHQSDFHGTSEKDAVSVFNVILNVANNDRMHRWTVQSKLRVEWTDKKDEDGLYIPGDLTLFDTTLLEREGQPAFKHGAFDSVLRAGTFLLVHDLNRDGFSDILVPEHNLLMPNRGDGQFNEQPLFIAPGYDPPAIIEIAIAADFNGDGHLDILCVAEYKTKPAAVSSPAEPGVFLFRGDANGAFPTPGLRAAPESVVTTSPQSVTAGDIDGDGDLDVWITQYRSPYAEGQMPTPFYDANDGYPSYLLLNQGDGTFVDGTESSGLAAKRHRRTYAASFVDLDEDWDLDLLVTSDFSGTDIYFNDGTGHFTDETDAVLRESTNFGMGHTFADYDQDGALDFYVTGMGSTTMRRLNQMGLIRADRPEYLDMRTRMGYGNRMYLARGERAFHQPDFKDNVARSGWSWGTTSSDFDNDGDMDLYIANGYKSGQTTKDYCTQFWRHDIYTGDSKPNPAIDLLFATAYGPNVSEELSWDGYQKNHLFMNQTGADFVNVAFLMNAALGDDCRSVIGDDFNGDGRPDLLVSSIHENWNNDVTYNKLHLLMNQWPSENNWIGVRLQTEPGGPSTIGAVIRIRSQSGDQVAHIVTGDSFRAQHAPMKHFGLGSGTHVDSIEIRWPDGTVARVEGPAINTYHIIRSSTAR